MLGEVLASGIGGFAALMAYAVRAPSSSLFGPSVHRGPQDAPLLSLTFDDGPSESTPQVLAVLAKYSVHATFFQCGANVRRLPEIARQVVDSGHEIGNHSDTHPYFCFRSPRTIALEFKRAQRTIEDILDRSPTLLRAPYGIRWFGFRETQRQLNLLGVMWTVIGNDWKLAPTGILDRIMQSACNGAIFCLHDGHELQRCPADSATAEALRMAIPLLLERGYRFETVSRLICPKN